MKQIKEVSAFLIIVFLVGGTVFAGGGKEGGGGKKVINVASTYPTGSPQDLGINRFKEEFEKATSGRYEVLIHPASAMGSERETFEAMEAGTVEIGMIGMMDIIMNYPRWTCSEVPFILPPDPAYFWKFWAGPGKELNELIEKEHGVRTVGVVLRGARYMTANKPIPNLAAAKGVKIRVPELKIMNDIMVAYGMIPANIAFGDVYMALKTGVVDAQENPPETILNYKFYEVQKYLMNTRHIFSSARFQISMKWYNTLSKEDQQIFDRCMKTGVDYANELTKNGDEEFIKQLIDKGMILVEVSDEFYNLAQPLLEEFGKTTLMPGLYERVKNL